MFYLKEKTIRITPISTHSKISLRAFTDSLRKSKQLVALMPNFVHSLDASSLGIL